MNPSFKAKPEPHPQAPFGRKVGVLLVNLGTPDGTDYWNMRRYLKQFLGDRRVIELPRLLWWPILHGAVLTTRPTKSGHAYASIWDKDKNASPLRVITEAQTAKLQARLGDNVTVRFAMRYGNPTIVSQLDALMKVGCGRILVAPLYPQYAAATTATVMDEVARWLLKQRWQPSIRQLPPYYDAPVHIEALADSLKKYAGDMSTGQPGVLLTSFHGLPLKYCQQGDVYYCHSHKTARLLAEKLGLTFCRTVDDVLADKSGKTRLLLTFQSRFGKAEWLQPYTDKTLEELAHKGIRNVAVACPGFAADCVETLEEIAIAGGEQFREAGGVMYQVAPCLNDSDTGMAMLETLVRNELKGWA